MSIYYKNIAPHLSQRIILSGYYGMQNVGDDCFCAIAGWGAQKFWNPKDLLFLSPIIPKIPTNKGKALFAQNQKIRGQNRLVLFYELMKNPLLVFAGGSIFHGREGWERQSIYHFNKFKKVNMGAIGVSLGPYKNKDDHKKVITMLQELSFLVLRDKESYDEACSLMLPYKPILGFDLAGLLPKVYGNKIPNNKNQKPILGVIPCHYERYKKTNTENETRRENLFLNTLIRIIQKTNCSVKLLIFNGHPSWGDKEYVASLATFLDKYSDIEIHDYCNDPLYFWRLISSCDAIFSIRLHGAIFACMAKIPFSLVEYHPKCSNFLEYIQSPSEWRIGDMELTEEEASEKIVSMLHDKKEYPINIEELEKKSLLNFVIIPP